MALAVAFLALPGLAGCLSDGQVLLAISAPLEADGLTIFAVEKGASPDDPARQLSYAIYVGDRPVYPPGGLGGTLVMAGGKASQFVPYNVFVEGNGRYEVRLRTDDSEERASVDIAKWVEYVFLHPYWKNGRAFVDVQLSKATGGHPDDRIVAQGDLLLEVRYRGPDGRLNAYAGVIRTQTPADETFTRVDVPSSTFNKGPGYYSFEATFQNDQAHGNGNVKNDPTMAARSPPWNWLQVKP